MYTKLNHFAVYLKLWNFVNQLYFSGKKKNTHTHSRSMWMYVMSSSYIYLKMVKMVNLTTIERGKKRKEALCDCKSTVNSGWGSVKTVWEKLPKRMAASLGTLTQSGPSLTTSVTLVFPPPSWSHNLIKCAQMWKLPGQDGWWWPLGTETRTWRWPHCEASPSEGNWQSQENARSMLWQKERWRSLMRAKAIIPLEFLKVIQDSTPMPVALNLFLNFSPSFLKSVWDKSVSPRRKDTHLTWPKVAAHHQSTWAAVVCQPGLRPWSSVRRNSRQNLSWFHFKCFIRHGAPFFLLILSP